MKAASFVLLVALLAAVEAAYGEGPAEGVLSSAGEDNQPVTVDADRITYDRPEDQIEAQGDVVISRGLTLLGADRVLIRRSLGEAEAIGEVVLEDPDARIRAESAWLDLDDETGYLVDGDVYLRRSRFLLGGSRIEKGFGQSYRIWDGALTTCLCDEGAPDWSIDGEQIDVELGGWGKVQSGFFRIKDVPILYLPYGLFPLNRDRQSGFLFPRFGISSSRGFQYVQPYYWAIDKSSDATISLDVETSARMGLLGEYRYALSPDASGIMTATYFNEQIGGDRSDEVVDEDIADPTVPENRWSVIGYHQQPGPWDSRFYAQPFYVSDNLFLRDMNVIDFIPAADIFFSTLRYTTSQVGMAKVARWGLLKTEAQWFQDLIEKQSRVPQPLPRLTLQLRSTALERLRLALNNQAVYYYRAPLSSGPRLDIAPEASLPYRTGPYGYGSVRLTLRETAYYLVNNDLPIYPEVNDKFETEAVGRFQHREILQASADFQSEVARVFEIGGEEIQKVKHTIEPFTRYSYIPLVNQDELPVYDYYDRINARNLVTYGVATRLLGKFGAPLAAAVPPGEIAGNALVGGELYGPPPPPELAGVGSGQIRELGRAWVQQSYEISRPIFFSSDLKPEQLSGVDVGLRLTPFDYFALNSRAVYSIADNDLAYTEVGAHIFDPRPVVGEGELFLRELRPVNSISIFYQSNADPFDLGGSIENLNVATTFRLTNHLALAYLGRFDAQAGRFLENYGGLRVISECDCWVIDLALVDRVNPDEIEVQLRVSLVGLATFGQGSFGSFSNFFIPPASRGLGLGAES